MTYHQFKSKVRKHPLFSTSLLPALTEDTETLKRQLSLWKSKALIQPLRKGLYVLNEDDRMFLPSLYYMSNQMYAPSYVSLETALSHYGLIPEFTAGVTAVSTKKTARFDNSFGVFAYHSAQPRMFCGFTQLDEPHGLTSWVAHPEKADVDFLYRRDACLNPGHAADMFESSYRFQNCGTLKSDVLVYYAKILDSKKVAALTREFIAFKESQ